MHPRKALRAEKFGDMLTTVAATTMPKKPQKIAKPVLSGTNSLNTSFDPNCKRRPS